MTQDECTIELFYDGRWRELASVNLLADAGSGWRVPTYVGYADDWAIDHDGAIDAHALYSALPVGIAPTRLPHWPICLIDMLPQGFGREEMLRRLGFAEHAQTEADWRLLMAGAGNPIGHLRVREAARWLEERQGPLYGFSDEEVAARSDDFAEYLARHGLFIAGSSGVQSEWPKLLLTRAEDGLLYLDHTLPDARASALYRQVCARCQSATRAHIAPRSAIYGDRRAPWLARAWAADVAPTGAFHSTLRPAAKNRRAIHLAPKSRMLKF